MKIQETIPNDFSTRNLVRTRSIQPEEKRTRELSTSEKLMEELRNNYKNIQCRGDCTAKPEQSAHQCQNRQKHGENFLKLDVM